VCRFQLAHIKARIVCLCLKGKINCVGGTQLNGPTRFRRFSVEIHAVELVLKAVQGRLAVRHSQFPILPFRPGAMIGIRKTRTNPGSANGFAPSA
jgi:hypothetical protein